MKVPQFNNDWVSSHVLLHSSGSYLTTACAQWLIHLAVLVASAIEPRNLFLKVESLNYLGNVLFFFFSPQVQHLVLFSNIYERSRGVVAQSVERPKGPSPVQLYWHGFESRPRRLARVLELSARIGDVEKNNNYERNPNLISQS